VQKIRTIALSVLAVYVAILGALFSIMRRPPLFGQVMRRVPSVAFAVIPFEHLWNFARAGSLKVGDNAPDFLLPTSDRKSLVQLSSFRKKEPVVLVFGSYT
jgi:hypothetical protein